MTINKEDRENKVKIYKFYSLVRYKMNVKVMMRLNEVRMIRGLGHLGKVSWILNIKEGVVKIFGLK